ncbi:MAG: alpha/beta hydrolase [Chloroflexi bacterium]|nr:alpha/beta hydrolase [Chloroflexota bacterium]
MVSAVGQAASTGGAADRFRHAERTLWTAYGLEPTERTIDLSEPGVRLRVQETGPETGSGDPVLFIGGSAGTGAYWAPLIRELPGRRAIVLDRPGWGLSSPIDYRRTDYGKVAAKIIRGVLDELGIDRVDVVGQSIGNLWGLHAARIVPNRIGALVLLGGSPNPEVPLPKFIKLLRSPIGAIMVRAPMKPGMLHKQLEALGHAATLARGGMRDFVAWRLDFQRHTPSMRHERAMVQAITAGDGFRPGVHLDDAALADVAQPTLMLFGTADPTGNQELWRRYVERLPDGRLELVADGGHNLLWDDPVGVGGTVRHFLDAA